MVNGLIGTGISLTLFVIGASIPVEAKAPNPKPIATVTVASTVPENTKLVNYRVERIRNVKGGKTEISFKWGDIGWLPELALQAGWPQETHEKLGEIILRESGGCPNRRGGDAVDENCNITHVTEWNHRSDSGLLQINGVNYNPKRNKWAIACRQLNICTQEPLLDPLTNLKVGYLLYQADGWNPWDPCAWGKEYSHRCKKKP
jgi:hypothetical protein